MAKRRQTVAPRNSVEVLSERIANLERIVAPLKQVGTTTIQTVDTEAYPDPVQGELLVNWPGVHVPATPADPVQYYHNDPVDPGFKRFASGAQAWIAVYDNFVYGNAIQSQDGVVEAYFPFIAWSDGSQGIFGYEAVDGSLTLGTDWTYKPTIKVDGLYTITYLAASENSLNRSRAQNRIYIHGEYEYPGQIGINWLSDFRDRDYVGFASSDNRWGRSWTLPIEVVGEQPITIHHALIKQSADSPADDSLRLQLWITYHGPINYSGSMNNDDDPGPP